jgi:hypothetical protein
MRKLYRNCVVLSLLGLAACADDPTRPGTPVDPENPKEPPTVLGVYHITVTGIGTESPSASVAPARGTAEGGPSAAISLVPATLFFEQVSSSSFTDGVRGQGGQRYVNFTFRVRNGTPAPQSNITMMLSSSAGTIGGTSLTIIKKFDGTNANPAIAPLIVPTGAVTLAQDLVTMLSPYPDVLQVYTEAEVAAISAPPGENLFPIGYVVRNSDPTVPNRTLPVATDANDYRGVLTLSFRLPLQSPSSGDPFSLTFDVVAVSDTETKLTETIEESQDTAAVRRLRDRATLLGATTTTVLNGSPVMDAAVPDYPGQRQICSPRTAGASGSPTNTIVSPGGYSTIAILRPGESLNSCMAYFSDGLGFRPATNVAFGFTVKAMDRYGNVLTGQVDTVHFEQPSGPPAGFGPAAPLVSGSGIIDVVWSDYGTSSLLAKGRRIKRTRPILVAGVTRTWTAGAGTTNWHTNGNWSPTAVPMSQDSVYVPASALLFPVLAANVSVQGVTVENTATISLNAFDLTAGGDVSAGLTGGITNTSGRLFLAGIAKTVQGKLPTLRVTGTYSLAGNVNARAPVQVDAGRITASAFRLQADSN